MYSNITIQYSSSGIAGPLFPWGQSRYNLDLSSFWRFLIIIFNARQIVARKIAHILFRCSPSFWPHCFLASGFSVLFLPQRWPLLPSHVFACPIHLILKTPCQSFLNPFLVSGTLTNYHVYLLITPFYYPQCISSGGPELLPTVDFFRRTIWFPLSNLNLVKFFIYTLLRILLEFPSF